MPDDQYIAVQRGGKWWFLKDGHRFGPFDTHEEAIASAVSEAKTEEPRRTAEVSWQDPDDGMPTVYKTRQ